MADHTFDFELAQAISLLAKKAKDSEMHWICTPNGEYETNSGNDWCRTCGYYVFKHLRRKDHRRRGEYFFDGGWRTESDGHRFCAHCGCWLRVSLTRYGIEEEIDHYRNNGVGLNSISDEAYSLDLLMNAVSWGSEYEAEVQAFAREFLSLPAVRDVLSDALGGGE